MTEERELLCRKKHAQNNMSIF